MNEVKKEKEYSEKEKMDNLIKIIFGFIIAAAMVGTMNSKKADVQPERDVIICVSEPGLFGLKCE